VKFTQSHSPKPHVLMSLSLQCRPLTFSKILKKQQIFKVRVQKDIFIGYALKTYCYKGLSGLRDTWLPL
jgi:hypothetical protein